MASELRPFSLQVIALAERLGFKFVSLSASSSGSHYVDLRHPENKGVRYRIRISDHRHPRGKIQGVNLDIVVGRPRAVWGHVLRYLESKASKAVRPGATPGKPSTFRKP